MYFCQIYTKIFHFGQCSFEWYSFFTFSFHLFIADVWESNLLLNIKHLSSNITIIIYQFQQLCCQKLFTFSKWTVMIYANMLAWMLSHFGCVRLCATPWTGTHQAPLSMGFSRQEYWSGFPFPFPVCEHKDIYSFISF